MGFIGSVSLSLFAPDFRHALLKREPPYSLQNSILDGVERGNVRKVTLPHKRLIFYLLGAKPNLECPLLGPYGCYFGVKKTNSLVLAFCLSRDQPKNPARGGCSRTQRPRLFILVDPKSCCFGFIGEGGYYFFQNCLDVFERGPLFFSLLWCPLPRRSESTAETLFQ